MGHTFSAAQLAKVQRSTLVRSFWYALRTIEDRYITSEYTASALEREGYEDEAARLRFQGLEDLAMIDQFHGLLQTLEGAKPPSDSSAAGSHS